MPASRPVFGLLLLPWLLLAAGAAGAAEAAPQPRALRDEEPVPRWPRQFRAEFTESTKLAFWSWRTTGVMLYDAEAQAELVSRANGRGDRYCLSIHPRTDTPCTHLVVGGARYIIFPQLGECCKCCSEAGGCGILDPDWLEGAEFIHNVTRHGRHAYEWTVRGLQPNIYIATADAAAVPLELDQLPNDYITFLPDTFQPGPIRPHAFDLPATACKERCPLTSVCTILQARATGAQLLRGVLSGARAPGSRLAAKFGWPAAGLEVV